MLARRMTLNHPLGGTIDLPLLIPAFSSKGFQFSPRGGMPKKGRPKPSSKIKVKIINSKGSPKAGLRDWVYSQTTRALEGMAPYIKEAILISAYDIYHEFYENPTNYFTEKSLVFIDSGGYELTPEFDSSEPALLPNTKESFQLTDYNETLKGLIKQSPHVPFVITTVRL